MDSWRMSRTWPFVRGLLREGHSECACGFRGYNHGMRTPLFPLLFVLGACVPVPEPTEPNDGGPTLNDAGETTDDDDGGAQCQANEFPLALVNYGDTDRYYVEVTLDGEQVAMQLDTGSSLNFLYQPSDAPPYTPNFADVAIGCEVVSVAARNLPLGGYTVDGLDVVGTLGMELLLQQPSLLDIPGERVIRYRDWPDAVANLAAFSVAFDNVQDHALVPMMLDDTEVRMMFDTGGGHTLWIGQEGQPGDQETVVSDAEGNQFTIYTGTGTMTLEAQPPRSIPLARAPSFPYFEETVEALGGNIHGLLGVTAFDAEALLFDGVNDRFLVIDVDAL